MKLQPAVKKETAFVAAGTAAMSLVTVVAFFGLHAVRPERVPADGSVVLGAVLGCGVAVLNFFLMAMTVQKVAETEQYDNAYRTMQISYRYRTFLQLIWCVLAMVLPFINPVAGILPLLWPSILIKARGILSGAAVAAEDHKESTAAADPGTETPAEATEENAGKEVNG